MLALWLCGTAIAMFFAMIQADSAVVGGVYIPRTNDSFYHAWRILDAVRGDHAIAQFDGRLNPPDGTLIPWPWAYDWCMARLTELALWIRPDLDPMAFLAYVPVAWIGINSALFLLVAGAAGLSVPMRALGLLGFALSPLTQLLHSVGMLDHHFVEMTFVLAVLWLGIAWFRAPDRLSRAIVLGSILGIAPAFHVGLFLLQLIPLTTVCILWLRGNAPPRRSLLAFAAALIVATQLVLLPSAAYRSGMFEFGQLSWFHFYVSCCTAIFVSLLGSRDLSRKSLAMVAAAALLLVIPLLANLIQGTAFVTGNTSILPDIAEARSPFRFRGESLRSTEGISYFSWLLLAVPLVLAWFGYRIVAERAAARLYFAVAAVLGLALLSLQFRFHYYGSFALILGPLAMIEDLRRRYEWHAGFVFVAAFLGLTLAYQPPLRDRLFTIYAAGADPDYEIAMGIHRKLAEVCAEDPGLVLADNDDGNPILFHSDCSVIANNFILGPEDDAKFARIADLMRSSPEALRQTEPPIRYLFVRANDFGRRVDGRLVLDSSIPIVSELILADELPPGFELLEKIDGLAAPDAEPEPFLRLYAVTPER